MRGRPLLPRVCAWRCSADSHPSQTNIRGDLGQKIRPNIFKVWINRYSESIRCSCSAKCNVRNPLYHMKNKPIDIVPRITSSLSVRRFRIPCIPVFLAAACLALSAMATSTLPFYEPFPSTYGENENFGLAVSSGVLWDFGNSFSSSCGRVTAAAAEGYPGLLTDTSSSKGLRSNPTGTGTKNRGASLTIPAATAVYASVLLKVVGTNLDNRPFFGFSTAASGSGVSLNGAVIYLNQN